MSEKEQFTDKELDEYLSGETSLSELYAESKSLKAPDHLGFNIKRMARDAEHKSISTSSKINKDVWVFPLSVAATVVLSIMLVFSIHIKRETSTLIAKNTGETTKKVLPIEQIAKQQTDNIKKAIEPEGDSKQTQLSKQNDKQTKDTSIASSNPGQPKKEKEDQIVKETNDFELPAHLQEALQNTGANSSEDLPPVDVLKTWSRKQWKKQVQTLQEAGKEELANKYIKEFPKYYPGEILKLYK